MSVVDPSVHSGDVVAGVALERAAVVQHSIDWEGDSSDWADCAWELLDDLAREVIGVGVAVLGWSEEGQKGVLWLGVVWASLSVLEPADGHSSRPGVKSCLWALWPALSGLWLAVILELFAERWGAIVEDVDNDVAIVVMVALSATADVVDLNSFWEEVGRVLSNWGP